MRQKIAYWYERITPHLIVPIGLVAAVAMVVAASAAVATEQQERERAALVECLNRWVSESSGTSSAVREATVERDRATAEHDRALNAEGDAFLRFMEELVRGQVDGPEDAAELVDALRDRARAADRLDQAQDELDRARKENPVPDPPAEFCSA